MIAQQQGQQANSNGKRFEGMIAQQLLAQGYDKLTTLPVNMPRKPFFIHQLRKHFTGIYNSPLCVDFFAFHPIKYDTGLVIECKYQEVAGSVDEKFPYVIANLKATGCATILLLIGSGAKRSAIDWCITQQNEKLRVFASMEAFIRAVNRENLL